RSASESRSASCPYWGWRREPGCVRMSASVTTFASSSKAMNSSIGRVPWPIVQMRTHRVWNTRTVKEAPPRPDVTVRPASPDQRNQGIATTLLDAAIEHLRKRGMRSVEAYPVIGEIPPSRWVFANYLGPLSMYVKAGFQIVEQLDGQAIVRREL